MFRRGIVARDTAQIAEALRLEPAPVSVDWAATVSQAARLQCGATHALAVLIELDEGADQVDFGGTLYLAIADGTTVATRQSRIVGGRDWVRLGAAELALDCLRRHLQGLPVTERTDFEKV